MITPEELVQAISDFKNGDIEAFNNLYDLSNRYLYVCIKNVMYQQNDSDAIIADMMQETYLEIFKSIGQLENNKDFLSWSSTIASRKCFANLKKNKRLVLLNEDDTTFEIADSDDIIPESIMQDREKQRLLREIIQNELKEIEKLCVIGYYYNEQKQDEIASELGIPLNTVKTNLSRAKAKIKEAVLKLEKENNTKLYSLSPLLLLLFGEEVKACAIPQNTDEVVRKSINKQSNICNNHFVSTIRKIPFKGKVAIGVASVAVIGVIGYAAFYHSSGQQPANMSTSMEQNKLINNGLPENKNSTLKEEESTHTMDLKEDISIIESASDTNNFKNIDTSPNPAVIEEATTKTEVSTTATSNSNESQTIAPNITEAAWKTAYREFLLANPDGAKQSFNIADVDDDSIPELLVNIVENGIANMNLYRYESNTLQFVYKFPTYLETGGEITGTTHMVYGHGSKGIYGEIDGIGDWKDTYNGTSLSGKAIMRQFYHSNGQVENSLLIIPKTSVVNGIPKVFLLWCIYQDGWHSGMTSQQRCEEMIAQMQKSFVPFQFDSIDVNTINNKLSSFKN